MTVLPMNRVVLFGLVGSVGFIVDAMAFGILFNFIDLELMNARAIAFFVAATTTWFGNRQFTFSFAIKTNPFHQWQKFMVTACISAVPNLATFKVCVSILGSEGGMVFISLLIGVLVGMISNFCLSSRWVFKTFPPQ
ncbi:GtrA family protein [Vibrio tasmaniensis]|uniref:GtrA family protein n=1 Tax=Vibrio tasmaniensis TaxID=212663 RepID=UPI001F0DE487|nr:GtrA family protein [Vibrio tasmaniensis]